MAEPFHQDIITEQEFARSLGDHGQGFFQFLNLLLRKDTTDWKKRHYAQLSILSHEVETYLDDHDARNNRAFAYPTELIASLRGFANVGISLKHLAARYTRYNVALAPTVSGQFFQETDRTVRFLNSSIVSMVRDLQRVLAKFGVPVTQEAAAEGTVGDDPQRPVLPNNIDEEDLLEEDRKIAEVATRYHALVEFVSNLESTPIEDPERLKQLVLSTLDEERCRDIESRVHSIQSKYDTYIRATTMESRNPALPRLRGHASLSLHLLEMATELVHFYVRHENDIRYEAAKAAIADLVDKREVLDRAINYAMHFAFEVLRAGQGLAEEVLEAFVQQRDLVVPIPEGTSLHARPISLIVKIVNHHGTRVVLEMGEESCNAGSIMEIIMIAGNLPDARDIRFRGDARTLEDLKLLFEHEMGERGLGHLPPQLDYLR